MLSPQDKKALAETLSQIIDQVSGDPHSADLATALQGAVDALDGHAAHAPADHAAPADAETPADASAPGEEPDPFSFDHAEAALTERRKGHK